jgi:hypothetical protein
MPSPKEYKAVYKRLETDVEFRRRIMERYPWAALNIRDRVGRLLDAYVDENAASFGYMQRRIVEDVV